MSAPAPSTHQAPKIAIKFGASSSSAKPSPKTKLPGHPKPPSTLGKRQRPHALGADSDSEDETEGRHEAVTSFGADGAKNEARGVAPKSKNATTAAAPFVIGGHKNKDWRADLRGGHKSGRSEAITETEPADQDKGIKWGLVVAQREPEDFDDKDSNHIENPGSPKQGEVEAQEAKNGPKDADTDAMDALLGKKPDSAKTFTIEGAKQSGRSDRFSEQDSYEKSLREAAEVSTMEEYDEIPEGEFGAAMLRGMGWDGKSHAAKPKEMKRRGHLLGLGAKEDDEIKKGELARKQGYRERPQRLSDYRRDEEKERQRRAERYSSSYKNERDRDRERGRRDGYRDGDRHRHRDDHGRRERHSRY